MTLPVALDTNLLVRLLTGDEPEQAGRVAQEELVRQALAWHRQGLDFADALDLRPAVQSL